MNCEPSALAESAACLQCLGGVADDVTVMLLCAVAGGTTPTPSVASYLITDEGDYFVTDEGGRIEINL